MNKQEFEKGLENIGYVVCCYERDRENTLSFYRKNETKYFCKITRWAFQKHFIIEITKKEKDFSKEPLLEQFLMLVFQFMEQEAKEKNCNAIILKREKTVGEFSKSLEYAPALNWIKKYGFDSFFKKNKWFSKPFVKELKKGYLDQLFYELSKLFNCIENVKKVDPNFSFHINIDFLHIAWFEYELFHQKQRYDPRTITEIYETEEKLIEMFVNDLEKSKKEWRLKWLMNPSYVYFEKIIQWILKNCTEHIYDEKAESMNNVSFREDFFSCLMKKGKNLYSVEVEAKKMIECWYDDKLFHKTISENGEKYVIIESKENALILKHTNKDKGYFDFISMVENKKISEIENDLKNYISKEK